MDKLLADLKDRMVALALSVVVFIAALLPVTALADGEFALDVGHGRGGGEGDPLDTNDADGGDAGDEDVHDNSGFLDLGTGIPGGGIWATRLLIVPEYNGTTIIFRIISLSGTNHILGERNAK